jgi:hypothetical protein
LIDNSSGNTRQEVVIAPQVPQEGYAGIVKMIVEAREQEIKTLKLELESLMEQARQIKAAIDVTTILLGQNTLPQNTYVLYMGLFIKNSDLSRDFQEFLIKTSRNMMSEIA